MRASVWQVLHGRRFLIFDGVPLCPKVHCCWLVPGHLVMLGVGSPLCFAIMHLDKCPHK